MARQSQPTVLLTRPLAQSQRFARDIGGALISPLMQPKFLTPAWPAGDFAAVIFTSETGVEAARRISVSGIALPTRAFCVGDRTAAAARSAGFDAKSAAGSVKDLSAYIQRAESSGTMLILRAQDSAGNLAEDLFSAGIETVSVVAYKQQRLPLSTEAVDLLRAEEPVIVPVFSPRSAKLLTAELSRIKAKAPIWLAALSGAVSEAFQFPTERKLVAVRPDGVSMRDLIGVMRGFA
ncbi:uroporphyrinogen-III synthase [Cypionkella sp.]|uniref:uroporphyrinogen-III synthase n=1 Tax=Cypionkella sp. TaxID=2811411 RepID=UPI0026354BB9|nr:uroporphyrinogen-III synthase [Cypionkella sp.]MDB5666015.1 Uroporphyrinogen synthase [Cypionkella sp.]